MSSSPRDPRLISRKFRVTVEEIETVEVPNQSFEKVADSGNPRDKGPIYEYVPNTKIETRTNTILSATVPELGPGAVGRVFALLFGS